jgi:hypothetical protein
MKSWKESDLPSFLGYGPDDVSQLYLVKCDLTKSEVQLLKDFMESTEEYNEEVWELMDRLHEEGEEIYCTTGDETWSVLEYLCENCRYSTFYFEVKKYNPNPTFDDEEVLKEELQEILFNNDDLWDKVLKEYIKDTY